MPILFRFLLALLAVAPSPQLGLLALARFGNQDGPSQRDERTPLERARDRASSAPAAEPALGPDGLPLVPGALPADATPEARAAWEAIVSTALPPDPVRAFDLHFYLRQRAEGPQSNDVKAQIQFLAPGFVRAMLKSGRQHLRGPDGDWLIDGEERIRLVGRDGAEDVRQIDEVVGIARNFVALTDPASLRIARLALRPEPPPDLPQLFRERSPRLQWISVTSPDFRLFRPASDGARPGPAPLCEAVLGVDPKTRYILLALIREAGPGTAPADSKLLLELSEQHRHDGFLIPTWIRLYQVGRESDPSRFREEPSSELKLMKDGVNLRAKLTPEDFAI